MKMQSDEVFNNNNNLSDSQKIKKLYIDFIILDFFL